MLADSLPLYPLYALLFVHTGLSNGEVSALFALWSTVGLVAEVPAGALADRYSRRGALVAAAVLQASGFLLWTALPGPPAFAAGFVLWGLGGALVSGALEALLYDGLAALGAEAQFASVLGRVTAAGLVAQLPAAVAATVLFSVGGYSLAGWVSVGCCLAAAGLACRLPEPSRQADLARPKAIQGAEPAQAAGKAEDGGRYLAVLRAGVLEAATRPGVRSAVVAVSVLSGMDALEEYFPLLARSWGVPTAVVPLAVLAIPLAGAACAALGGRATGVRPWTLGVLLGVSALALGSAGLQHTPIGLAGVALFYGLYRLVLVVANARLQEQIEGSSRATVTSVAALGTEIAAFGLYAAWALGHSVLVAGLVALAAACLPRLLGR
ncbi:MAG: MFS transporter [Actinomycetota bacterium]|nr:MFS transporter [Actinomycetota bacterium]